MENKRSANPKDKDIGRRIRLLRLQRGLSQTELGEMLGVSFQQVQKYEKGSNRVSAARLRQIADELKVPITMFYDGNGSAAPAEDSLEAGLEFLQTAGAVRLVRAYARIRDPMLRRALVELAEKIAPDGAGAGVAA